MSGVLVGFVAFLVASGAIYLLVQCIGPAAGADAGHGHGHGHGHH
ncbi:hypothetical protein [Magnetospirillum moscoviense]|nr:hypothetical protein [Magnetospirillum moscoviense]